MIAPAERLARMADQLSAMLATGAFDGCAPDAKLDLIGLVSALADLSRDMREGSGTIAAPLAATGAVLH